MRGDGPDVLPDDDFLLDTLKTAFELKKPDARHKAIQARRTLPQADCGSAEQRVVLRLIRKHCRMPQSLPNEFARVRPARCLEVALVLRGPLPCGPKIFRLFAPQPPAAPATRSTMRTACSRSPRASMR